jgi:hypothetical protein
MINQVTSWGGLKKENLMRVTLSRVAVAKDRLEGGQAAVLNDLLRTDGFSGSALRSLKAQGLVVLTDDSLELMINSSEKLTKWLEAKLSKLRPLREATVSLASAGGAGAGGGGSGARKGEAALHQKPFEASMPDCLSAAPKKIIQELCGLISKNPNMHWSFINDKAFLDVLRSTHNLMFWFLELMPGFLKSPDGLEFLGRRTEEALCASVESVMERLLVLKQYQDRLFMGTSTAMAFHAAGQDAGGSRKSAKTSESDFPRAGAGSGGW